MGRELNGPEKYGIVDKLKLKNCGEPALLLIAAQLVTLELVTSGTYAVQLQLGSMESQELANWHFGMSNF